VPTAGWIKRSAIYVLSIVLMDGIRMDNVVERTIMKSQVLQLIIKLLIVAWMGFISYSIISDVYHKWSNVWIE
jgi:capsular polysaccharide biosynthesis protein